MRIGFLAANVWEATRHRAGITNSHYTVEGYLASRLLERGHEVVLLTRVAESVRKEPGMFEDPSDRSPFDYLGFQYDPEGDPTRWDLDVLWVSRLERASDMYDVTVDQILEYEGPVVYHQVVTYRGWAPPFSERIQLAGGGRNWLVINRADDAEAMYWACAAGRELPRSNSPVRFATWRPFMQLDSIFDGEMLEPGERLYAQGYVGRFPRGEDRTRRVVHFLDHEEWSRVIYGRTTGWASEKTGSTDGGPAEQGSLKRTLETFSMSVACQFDGNPRGCGFWPNRIVECALGGVLQLFDTSWGLDEFSRWVVTDREEMIDRWGPVVRNAPATAAEVHKQRGIILPRCDPDEVVSEAERRMEEACSL